ncbi:glycoside hydrolase [Thraustotheca clavata]|uniref:Glycoside hydrolase n=1 Tax=Thraustotheca clavata TaxID=74557 RepID=A0A1W0A5M4_9STRA|nr:glycoside hydrolase [Thraustotheca clavata]
MLLRLTLLAVFANVVMALAPILVRGNKLFNAETGDRFFMRGMTYEYDVSDENYANKSKAAIARAVKDFNGTLNTLRVYNVNPEKSYKEFMSDMADEGIYVMLSASPSNVAYYGSYQWSTIRKDSNADSEDSCYKSYLLNYGKRIALMFSQYNNTLGLVMANEVMQASLRPAACVKQYIADLKNWMRGKSANMRVLPLAYAAADSSYAGSSGDPPVANAPAADEYAIIKIQGLLCGDTMVDGVMQQSIDMYLINEYRWCNSNNFGNSYSRILALAKGVPIVMGLGEYGCDLVSPRKWEMIPYLFDNSSEGFTNVYSGGFAYSFGEATLPAGSKFPLFTGGDSSITGNVGTTPTASYTNLLDKFTTNPTKGFPVAAWKPESKCDWTPPITTTVDPSNKRAQSGWILPTCDSVKIQPTDTWVTKTREGMVCNNQGGTCDVSVPSPPSGVPTNKAICNRADNVTMGGGTCVTKGDCKNGGSCNNGQCKCSLCYSGPNCGVSIASCSGSNNVSVVLFKPVTMYQSKWDSQLEFAFDPFKEYYKDHPTLAWPEFPYKHRVLNLVLSRVPNSTCLQAAGALLIGRGDVNKAIGTFQVFADWVDIEKRFNDERQAFRLAKKAYIIESTQRVRQELNAFKKRDELAAEVAKNATYLSSIKAIRYSNGDKYEGQVVQRDNVMIPDGKGTLFVRDKTKPPDPFQIHTTPKYIGFWLQGLKHGKGQYFWDDKSSWEGAFIADEMSGKGVFREYVNEDDEDQVVPEEKVRYFYKGRHICWGHELQLNSRLHIYISNNSTYTTKMQYLVKPNRQISMEGSIVQYDSTKDLHYIRLNDASEKWVSLNGLDFELVVLKPIGSY